MTIQDDLESLGWVKGALPEGDHEKFDDLESPRGIRVTAEDLETGDVSVAEIMDDYALICAGSCYIHAVQVHATGTVQLTIKGRKAR